VFGTTGASGAIRMPAAPATAPASIQFNNAMRSGEIPLTYAPVSDSATARVSRPNRVHRYSAVMTNVIASTVTARYTRSDKSVMSCHVHRSDG
jgi:hypothetical protein